MRARSLLVLVPLAVLALVACSGGKTPLPLIVGPPPPGLSSTVFAGRAEASRFVKGSWVETPEYDYDFTVLERRFADHWEVVKEIHRRHPRYNGLAGKRDQTLYFEIRTSPAADGGLDLVTEGSLGSGRGHESPGGGLLLEMVSAKKGLFVPFDSVRIRQDRSSAPGRLQETVELFSRKDGREIPFMRMQETGVLYRPAVP